MTLNLALQTPKASSTALPPKIILVQTLRGIFQEIICAIIRIRAGQLQRPNQESPIATPFVKKPLIHQYHNTTTNPTNSFYIIPTYVLPKERDVPACPGRQVSRHNYFSGVGVHLTTADILGDLHKSPEAHGAICHLAHAVLQPGHTPCQQGCSAEFRVTRHSSDRGKSQHFNSISSGSTQVSSTPFITSLILSFKPLLHLFFF